MRHRKPNCISCGVSLIEGSNWRQTALVRRCSNCISSDRKNYYKENQGHINKLRKKSRIERPEQQMLSRVKTRAKKLGLPFDLELSDIQIPKECPVFKVPFVLGEKSKWNPSLDRIIPEKGYVKGNVVVISVRANSIKNDATPEELRLIADFVDKLLVSRYE